jgi:hypothetical protein
MAKTLSEIVGELQAEAENMDETPEAILKLLGLHTSVLKALDHKETPIGKDCSY